jgi:8-oxo-dGTP pyrophosphatase MutT (NUDIX family)
MVRQYKHGAREILLELPGGLCDANEPPEEAAQRELLEETGYAADRLTPLATLHDDPTRTRTAFTCSWPKGCTRCGSKPWTRPKTSAWNGCRWGR